MQRTDITPIVDDLKEIKRAITMLNNQLSAPAFETAFVAVTLPMRTSAEVKLSSALERVPAHQQPGTLAEIARRCNLQLESDESVRAVQASIAEAKARVAALQSDLVTLMKTMVVTQMTTPSEQPVLADVAARHLTPQPPQPPQELAPIPARTPPRPRVELKKASLTNPLLVLSRFVELPESVIYPFGKEESMYSSEFVKVNNAELPAFWVKSKDFRFESKVVIGWRMVNECPVVHVYQDNNKTMRCFLAPPGETDLDICQKITLEQAVAMYLCQAKRGAYTLPGFDPTGQRWADDPIPYWEAISIRFKRCSSINLKDGSVVKLVLPAVQTVEFSQMTA
jgi:hypothetical protein